MRKSVQQIVERRVPVPKSHSSTSRSARSMHDRLRSTSNCETAMRRSRHDNHPSCSMSTTSWLENIAMNTVRSNLPRHPLTLLSDRSLDRALHSASTQPRRPPLLCWLLLFSLFPLTHKQIGLYSESRTYNCPQIHSLETGTSFRKKGEGSLKVTLIG